MYGRINDVLGYNQSIGFLLCSIKYSFVLLKGLEPKKPLVPVTICLFKRISK